MVQILCVNYCSTKAEYCQEKPLYYFVTVCFAEKVIKAKERNGNNVFIVQANVYGFKMLVFLHVNVL